MESTTGRPHRLGLIGYGGYGRFLVETWRSIPNLETVALAGRNREGVERAARELRVPSAYSGDDAAARLILAPDVEVVAIASPPSDHAAMAIEALEAGKHVFCEKPLATTLEDARRVRDAVNRSGKRLAMGFVLRHDPLFHRLKEVVESGIFGDLHRIDFRNFAGDEALDPDHWFWDLSRSGGILVEHGVHFFDVYAWIAGSRARRVTGHRTVRPGTTQEDRVVATVEYESGLLATFYHAFDKPSRLERTVADLAFDRAYVTVDGWIALAMTFDAALQPGGREHLDRLLPGWETIEREEYGPEERRARGSGHDYPLAERVHARWTLSDEKQEVYAACARASLIDLLLAIEDPGHAISADVDAGVESVRTATAVRRS